MKRLAVVTVFLAALVASSSAGQRIKLAASLSDLEKAARKDSNDAAAHYNVALAYWNAKRWDDTDSALHRAVRLDPRFAPAHLALSRMVFAQRPQLWDEIYELRIPIDWRPRVDESYRLYQRAFMVDPLLDLRILGAVRPSRGLFWETNELLYDYLFQGLDDVQTGQYEAAYNRLTRLYDETHPVSLRDALPDWVFYYKGLAAAHIGRFPEAIGDFTRLLDRELSHQKPPDSLAFYIPIEINQYRYIIAVLKQMAGRFNEAITLYREALQNDIGLYMAHVRLAQIYEDHNMLPQAVAERRAAVNANPDDPSLLLDLGKTLALANQLIDAEKTLQDAVAANPRDPRSHYFLGIVQQRQNKVAAARTAFTQFIALAPSRYAPQVTDAKQRLDALR